MGFGTLSDIKIIDLTQMVAGPYGAMFFADNGADVIKVEPPHGDGTRLAGGFFSDDEEQSVSPLFQSLNRNKKSVMLDLKTDAGKNAFLALIKDADAVIENFRMGVMEKLGLGYEDLALANPKLVYGSIRGFGDKRTGESPYAAWPAFDIVAQAMGGIISVTGPDAETPTKTGPGIGDLVPGLMMSFGVLSAIHHARRTGEGQYVDVSMVDGVLSLTERIITQIQVQEKTPAPEGNHHPFGSPFGLYPAKDGFIAIAAPSDEMFELFCKAINADELLEDERFDGYRNRAVNRALLAEGSASHTQRQ